MNIDRKYKIHAVNPCSRNTHDEYDSILFLAKDKAVPAMLRAYLKESEKLGANPAHLESIGLLIGRVEQYQREVEAKIPDTDLPCEIRRCVDGEGVSDNKQDLAPGAQNVPKAVAYLDLGVGGYMDIGTDLTDEELATLPKGRHMLGIIGTYGVDGYVPAQPAPSVPECPYPCGWRNLLKHAIEDGAYLARSINEDEPVTENARSVTMRTVMRLRNVLMAINNAAPEAKP